MKKLLPLLAIAPLVFTSCGKKSEPAAGSSSVIDTSASASAVGSTTSFNSALTNVVSNLETNGSHLSITHVDEDLKQLAKAVDGVLDMARESSDEIPPNLNAVALLKDLGLSKIDAFGRSSRSNNGVWHNRFFLQTNGDRSGLLSVMGEEGSKWRAGEIAPADADMVIEFELNLRRLTETMKVLSASFGEEAEQGIAEAMQQQLAGGALTLADVFGKTDLRSTLIVSMDREKRWNVSEEVKLPTMNATLCIERGMWLWNKFGEQIEKTSEVSERDGLKIVMAPEEMETPMGKIRPVIVLDEAKDLIWISLNQDYLDKCRSKENTLASSDDFKQATAGFPDKGNGLFYVSADFCEEVIQQVKQIGDNLPEDSEEAEVFGLLNGLIGLSEKTTFTHGYAWCVSNTKTGILCVANSMFPDKGYGMLSGVAPIAALSGLAAPMVIRQRSKADQTQTISNMRQFIFALIEYEDEKGRFPTQLSELVDAKIITAEDLEILNQYRVDGDVQQFIYIPGRSMSDNPNTIILHTPTPIDGKHVFLSVDGSVKLLPEDEFLELIENQQSPE